MREEPTARGFLAFARSRPADEVVLVMDATCCALAQYGEHCTGEPCYGYTFDFYARTSEEFHHLPEDDGHHVYVGIFNHGDDASTWGEIARRTEASLERA